jgi:tripartite-type tricarboxylate transporter receptor subunit TctC
VSKIERRKAQAETPPIISKSRRTQARLIEAGLHGHPHTVKATKLRRRQFLHLATGAVVILAMTRTASAQTYPTRPITMIVPLAAGSSNDVIGRVLAERMKGSLGQPIIVENVTGADGSIGTGRAARARPDGYTIDLGFLGANVLNGAFYSLQYDVLNDLAPISPLVGDPHVLFARKTMPAKDLNELIAWLKSNPNKASTAVSALGPHMEAALFQKETGTHLVLVPYRSGRTAMQDLVAGHIDLTIYTPDQLPLVRTGSIKAYAVTGEKRSALAPDIPTYAELDFGQFSNGQMREMPENTGCTGIFDRSRARPEP